MLITLFDKEYDVRLEDSGVYQDGTPAIRAIDRSDGSPFGTLTVSVPGTRLKDDEILVKTWSENSWVLQLLGKGFEDTGRRVKLRHVEAQIWRRTPNEDSDSTLPNNEGSHDSSCCGDNGT